MFPALMRLHTEMGALRKDITITDGPEAKYIVIMSRPQANFPEWLDRFGISREHPTILGYSKLDGVPLWILYQVP